MPHPLYQPEKLHHGGRLRAAAKHYQLPLEIGLIFLPALIRMAGKRKLFLQIYGSDCRKKRMN
ncbi:MAG: hypothetical protein IPO71_03410 [Nitrosomonas sp.]|nr:hypothetical protein [Nitrosomonas sp.]